MTGSLIAPKLTNFFNSNNNRIFSLLLCSILVMLSQLSTFRIIVWDNNDDSMIVIDIPHHGNISRSSRLQEEEVGEFLPLRRREATGSNYFSACLLVKDDNHYLIEWLAYHYHVLPLKRLIIAIDPKSQTSPSNILRRYTGSGRMNITEWTDDDFFPHLHRSIVMGESFTSTIDSGSSSLNQATTTAAAGGGGCGASVVEKMKRKLQTDTASGKNNFNYSIRSIVIDSSNKSNYHIVNVNATASTPTRTMKYKKPHRTKDEKLVLLHRTRQRHFFANCMKQLQDENMTWTALIDSDEFLVPNYQHEYFKRKGQKSVESKNFFIKYFMKLIQAMILRDTTNLKQSTTDRPNHRTATNTTSSPNTVLQLIQVVQNDIDSSSPYIYNRNKQPMIKDEMMQSPCISIPRILIGTKESPSNVVESPLSNETLNNINTLDFLTLRWRYYGIVKNSKNMDVTARPKKKHQPGKAIVDVSRIPRKSLSVLHVLNPHRPVEECLVENTWIAAKQSLFLSHHYVGTYPQWTFRDDPRTGAWKQAKATSNATMLKKESSKMSTATATRSRERYETFAQLHSHTIDDSIRGWLQDFIQQEGLESALELLKGAGQVGVQ